MISNLFFRSIDTALFKEVMFLAFPIIISNISRVFMHITDIAMVGHLGKNSLVAVSMGGMILWIAISVGIGLRAATQAVTARRLGENKLPECAVALRNAQLICFFVMMPISLFGLLFSNHIVPLYISDPQVIPLCSTYLSIGSLSIYFSVSAFIFHGFYAGIEKTRVLMYVTILSNIFNVYLNAGLIYGSEFLNMFFESNGISWVSILWSIYEFPALGVKGAAIATLLSSILMMILYTLYLFKSNIRKKFQVMNLSLDWKMIKRQIEIAYPQSISEVLLNLAFNMFYIIMGIIGTVQLAATQVVFTVAHASFLPAVGVGQACATLVGKYLGKYFVILISSLSIIVASNIYTLNLESTNLEWIGRKLIGEHNGSIQFLSGYVEIDNKRILAGEFKVNMKSIENNDIEDETYKGYLENHLKSEDFFDVENFPVAILEIIQENNVGESIIDSKGNSPILCNLTIKGITHQIMVPMDVKVYNNHATASGTIDIDRTLYKIKYKSKSFFPNIGDKLIYDNFTLNFNINTNREWEK